MENKCSDMLQQIKICREDEEKYPQCLRELKERPSILYYRGDIEILNQYRSVAVIGSRKISENGGKLAFHTGNIVGKKGLNLINGLALGCDTEALKGSLKVGGRCVAILPCGLNEIYPKSNQWLAEEILKQGGCLISEYPAGTRPEKYRFVQRDRLQSGISQGVLVIEAMEKSGTMHTVEYAKRQSRRIACYYHGFLKYATGNSKIENSYSVKVIKENKDLEEYLDSIKKELEYTQMCFDFI